MSIVPFSCLGASDRLRLGNNIGPASGRRSAKRRRRRLRAVNRSLAVLGEQVASLWSRPCVAAPADRR